MRPRRFSISSPCDSRRFLSLGELWLAVALGPPRPRLFLTLAGVRHGGGVTTEQ